MNKNNLKESKNSLNQTSLQITPGFLEVMNLKQEKVELTLFSLETF